MLLFWLLLGICIFTAGLAYYFRDLWRARRRRPLELRGIELLPTSIRYKDYFPLPPQSSDPPNLYRQQSSGHLSIDFKESQLSPPSPSAKEFRSTPSSPSIRPSGASWKPSGQLQSRHQRGLSEPFIRLPWDDRTLASSSSRRSLYELPLSSTSYTPASTRPSSPLSSTSEDLAYARKPEILSIGSPLVDDHASLKEEPMLIHFSPQLAPIDVAEEEQNVEDIDFLDLESALPPPPRAVLGNDFGKDDVVVHVLPVPSRQDDLMKNEEVELHPHTDNSEESHIAEEPVFNSDSSGKDVVTSTTSFSDILTEDRDAVPRRSEGPDKTDKDPLEASMPPAASLPPRSDVGINVVSDVSMNDSAPIFEDDLSGPDFKKLVREELSSVPIVSDVWVNEKVPVFEEDSFGPDFKKLTLEQVSSVPLAATQPAADPEIDISSYVWADYKVPAFEEDSSGPELQESVLKVAESEGSSDYLPEAQPTAEPKTPTAPEPDLEEEEDPPLPLGSYYPSSDFEVEMVSDTISVFRNYREQVFPAGDISYFSPFSEDSCGPAVPDPVVQEMTRVDVAADAPVKVTDIGDAEDAFQEDSIETLAVSPSSPDTEVRVTADNLPDSLVQNSAETGPGVPSESSASNVNAELESLTGDDIRDSQQSQIESPSVADCIENNDKHDNNDNNDEQTLDLHPDPPLPSFTGSAAAEELEEQETLRPAWSLRAADAPPLGIATQPTESCENEGKPTVVKRVLSLPGTFPTQESDSSVGVSTVETTRREVTSSQSRRRFIRSPIDIALAMQLRPGLGMGADSAWMVRFLMSMFGWFVVLLSGTGNYDGYIRPTH